jgi:hypothetical protein
LTNPHNMALAGIALILVTTGAIVTLLALHLRRTLPRSRVAQPDRLGRIEDIHGVTAHALRRYDVRDEAELVLIEAWYKSEVQE